VGTVPTLSYSSVRTYLECPLRWKYLYLERLPEAPRGYFSFGRTVHSVLEELLRPYLRPTARRTEGLTQRTLEHFGDYRAEPPEPIRPEELLELYERRWIPDGYESPEEERRYRELGRTLLLRYHQEVVRQPPTPVAIEAHLEAKWEGVPIHGYVDRIDLTPAGGLEVVDYKTSRGLTVQDALTSDQLALYQVLVEHNFPNPVEGLALIDLRGGIHLASPPRPTQALAALRVSVGEVSDGIRDEEYAPTPGRACARCEFRDRCPEFKEVPAADRERLAVLVDRFVDLRDSEQNLERELRGAALALHEVAERLGLHRIPGERGVAVRRRERAARSGAKAAEPAASMPRPIGRWYWEIEAAARASSPRRTDRRKAAAVGPSEGSAN
jgi:putative RecB family exonuclease